MRKSLFFSVLALVCLCSCDEGRIPEKTITIDRGGRVLKLTGTFSGIQNWANSYKVVVAGFVDDNKNAQIYKALPVNQEDGEELVMTLSAIPDAVTSLHLCVLDRLNERVASFYSIEDEELAAVTDTVRMNVGTLDVGMFAAIQSHVFDAKCAACHGNTGTASAGLFLTSGRSYEALFNVPSHINASMLLVKPGDAEESFLHLVLNRDGDTKMRHVDMFSEDEQPLLEMIDDWIDSGAQP